MAGYADCLAGFIERLGLGRPHVAGLSFGGALALALAGRHPRLPRTLVLASAYAGWAGSLPAKETARRLRQAQVLADLSPAEFVATLLSTMFSPSTPPGIVEAFGASMRSFHPAGFRAMASASAENLRDALPPHQRPHPAPVRRRRRPRSPPRRRGPPPRHPRLDPGRPPRRRARLQPRGSGGVQPGGAELPLEPRVGPSA
jgi:pimeloyl-ACP methyl ester carboxylesterase